MRAVFVILFLLLSLTVQAADNPLLHQSDGSDIRQGGVGDRAKVTLYDESGTPVTSFGTGGVVTSTVLLNDGTTATPGVAVATRSGFKTFWATLSGTGAVTATANIYGHRNTTVSERVLLCTFTLTGSTVVPDICGGSATVNVPYMSVDVTAITGTNASLDVEVFN